MQSSSISSEVFLVVFGSWRIANALKACLALAGEAHACWHLIARLPFVFTSKRSLKRGEEEVRGALSQRMLQSGLGTAAHRVCVSSPCLAAAPAPSALHQE
jgi:hypothetical protein